MVGAAISLAAFVAAFFTGNLVTIGWCYVCLIATVLMAGSSGSLTPVMDSAVLRPVRFAWDRGIRPTFDWVLSPLIRLVSSRA